MSVPRYLEAYLARGWPLLVCKPRSKKPIGELVPNGVHDATNDRDVIARWSRLHPDANWAVACGSPGPQVLDIDYPERAPEPVLVAARRVPFVASHRTPRSGHAHFEGTEAGTVILDYGELRGRGHYAMVPPSIHPCGEPYRWVRQLQGRLLPAPALERQGHSAGAGQHSPPARPIIAGEGRHPYLADFAVRMVRSGITDHDRIAAHLELEFRLSCELLPPPTDGFFGRLADWAAQTGIAGRERELAHLAALIRDRERET